MAGRCRSISLAIQLPTLREAAQKPEALKLGCAAGVKAAFVADCPGYLRAP